MNVLYGKVANELNIDVDKQLMYAENEAIHDKGQHQIGDELYDGSEVVVMRKAMPCKLLNMNNIMQFGIQMDALDSTKAQSVLESAFKADPGGMLELIKKGMIAECKNDDAKPSMATKQLTSLCAAEFKSDEQHEPSYENLNELPSELIQSVVLFFKFMEILTVISRVSRAFNVACAKMMAHPKVMNEYEYWVNVPILAANLVPALYTNQIRMINMLRRFDTVSEIHIHSQIISGLMQHLIDDPVGIGEDLHRGLLQGALCGAFPDLKRVAVLAHGFNDIHYHWLETVLSKQENLESLTLDNPIPGEYIQQTRLTNWEEIIKFIERMPGDTLTKLTIARMGGLRRTRAVNMTTEEVSDLFVVNRLAKFTKLSHLSLNVAYPTLISQIICELNISSSTLTHFTIFPVDTFLNF